jgi:hypothetical protein
MMMRKRWKALSSIFNLTTMTIRWIRVTLEIMTEAITIPLEVGDANTLDTRDTRDNNGGNNYSVGSHTLNSEYTKSYESEVEDALKDFFMIGDAIKNKPGKRPKRHAPYV